MVKYYVLCDDDCRYESMTAEQILTAIEEALEQGHVSDPDGAVFSKIKEIRAGATAQIWVGTEAQYNAISPAPAASPLLVRIGSDGVMYLCKDDSTLTALLGRYTNEQIDEKFTNVSVAVDNTVTSDGANAVSGAAVAAYVSAQIAAIINYDEVAM